MKSIIFKYTPYPTQGLSAVVVLLILQASFPNGNENPFSRTKYEKVKGIPFQRQEGIKQLTVTQNGFT